MNNSVMYSCTSLAGSNKVGNLKKLDGGYYEVIVGALNMFNSAGAFYPYDAAKSLFEESSQFQRRVARGALRGEYGHPIKQPGMSNDDFAARCMSITENDVCVHHRKITLDFDRVKDENGRPVIAIISELCPSGPKGEFLDKSLNNPSENVCFSIRAFTADKTLAGIKTKSIRTIITWDMVNEPGLSIAEKFKSPSLESHDEQLLTRGAFERAVHNSTAAECGVAMESSIMLTANELFQSMGWQKPREFEERLLAAPGWRNW